MNRRRMLSGLLAAGVAACVDPEGQTDTESLSSDTDASDTEGSDTEPQDTGDGSWAQGGTAAMGEDYPITFDDDCVQICEMTLGPCFGTAIEGRDMSEGVDGLPMRMALRIVDTDCNPIEGAVVDVWHCAPNGLYSGDEGAAMCNDLDAEALASNWFRGSRVTDADGVALFDSCLPGWYRGRAVHIHLQVQRGDDSWLISQLGFDEALLDSVMRTHPAYAERGMPDTPNDGDSILSEFPNYLFEWAQADDGVLVVWRTLGLRSSLDDETC